MTDRAEYRERAAAIRAAEAQVIMVGDKYFEGFGDERLGPERAVKLSRSLHCARLFAAEVTADTAKYIERLAKKGHPGAVARRITLLSGVPR